MITRKKIPVNVDSKQYYDKKSTTDYRMYML